jgi:acyl-coenzyme A synthetase/AMP-(fatty) acid ligase
MHYIDWFHSHAAIRPAKLAIVSPRVALTYAQFYRAALRTAHRLAESKIEAGQTIGLYVRHPALYSVLAAALNRMGCVIIGFNTLPGSTQAISAPAGVQVDRFVVDQNLVTIAPADAITVDLDWLKSDTKMMKGGWPGQGFRDADSIVHIFTTSGTTGYRKAVAFSTRQLMTLFSRRSFGILGDGRESLYCTFGVQSAAGFIAAFWTFWSGCTLFQGWAAEAAWPIISQNRIARVEGSPAQYREMLQSSDAAMFDLSSLRLAVTAGSVAPQKLVADIRSKVCSSLLNYYGSTEAGIVSYGLVLPSDPDGHSGELMPWVQAEVVDEKDRVLQAGEEGMLRFRCDGMPNAYINDSRAAGEHFKGGWFYPGDMGTISAERVLTISGRSSERLNAGGVKVNPSAIENVITSYPGISECAVFGLPDKFGLDIISAAVVAHDPIDITALQTYCASRLGPRTPRNYMQLKALPRNAAGKILRAELAKIALAQIRTRIEP